jgi:hypothetical protein
VVDRAPVGLLGRLGVSLARQPPPVARHDQRGLRWFEVPCGVGAPPEGGEVPVGLGDTQPQANAERFAIGMLQRGLGRLGHGEQGRSKLHEHVGVVGDGGHLGEEQRDPGRCGVVGLGEGVQGAAKDGERPGGVLMPGGHGLERLDLRLLGRRQPAGDRLHARQERRWPEPLLDVAGCHLQAELGGVLRASSGQQGIGLPPGEQVSVRIEAVLAEPHRDRGEDPRGLGGVAWQQALRALSLPVHPEVAERPAHQVVTGEPGAMLRATGAKAGAELPLPAALELVDQAHPGHTAGERHEIGDEVEHGREQLGGAVVVVGRERAAELVDRGRAMDAGGLLQRPGQDPQPTQQHPQLRVPFDRSRLVSRRLGLHELAQPITHRFAGMPLGRDRLVERTGVVMSPGEPGQLVQRRLARGAQVQEQPEPPGAVEDGGRVLSHGAQEDPHELDELGVRGGQPRAVAHLDLQRAAHAFAGSLDDDVVEQMSGVALLEPHLGDGQVKPWELLSGEERSQRACGGELLEGLTAATGREGGGERHGLLLKTAGQGGREGACSRGPLSQPG